MPDPLPDIFLSAINDCYNEYGWKTIVQKTIPAFSVLESMSLLKSSRKDTAHGLQRRREIQYGKRRCCSSQSLIEQNSNIYDTVNTIPFEDLLSKTNSNRA